MGLLDIFKRTEIVEVEKPTLLDSETQRSLTQLNNMATSYMKSKQDIIEQHKTYSNKVNQQADYVTKKTIKDWRTSLISARDIDKPNRYWLLDLYAELRLDPFLDAVVTFQKNKLTHIKRYMEDQNGNVDDKATKLFNEPWFDQVISGYVESALQGFDLLEINQIVLKKGMLTIDRLDEVPSKNVIPEFQLIKKDGYSYTSGTMPYANNDYIIEIINDNNRNLGILNKLAPYILWKKLSLSSWSNFIEDFGSPSMVIKTPIKNTDAEDELLASLENIGSSLKMVLDQNDDFELVQPDSNDVYQSFKEMIQQTDNVISNEIIEGTLLFQNGDGGSYNLSSTHESVSQLKTLADLKSIEKFVNQFLIPKLQRLGVLDNNEYNFYFTPEEFLTMSARAEIDARILPYVNMTKDYLEDTYKVKIESMKENGGTGFNQQT